MRGVGEAPWAEREIGASLPEFAPQSGVIHRGNWLEVPGYQTGWSANVMPGLREKKSHKDIMILTEERAQATALEQRRRGSGHVCIPRCGAGMCRVWRADGAV